MVPTPRTRGLVALAMDMAIAAATASAKSNCKREWTMKCRVNSYSCRLQGSLDMSERGAGFRVLR
jgi:hypothetical protein